MEAWSSWNLGIAPERASHWEWGGIWWLGVMNDHRKGFSLCQGSGGEFKRLG